MNSLEIIKQKRHQLEVHKYNSELRDLVYFENSKIDLWLSPKRDSTKNTYEKAIREFFSYHKTKLLKDITAQDVNDFLYNYLEGLDLSTVKLYRSALSSLFSELQKIGYIKVNPVKQTTAIKTPLKFVDKVLSQDEVSVMIRRTDNLKHKLCVQFLYETGLRSSEMLSLKKEVLRKEKDVYKLPVHGKGNKTRIVQARAALVEKVLLEFDVSKGHIFTSRESTSEPMTRQNLYSIVSQSAKRAKVFWKVGPHDLRHAHATHSIKNGCPLHVLMDSLGHSSLEVTKVYLHLVQDEFSGKYLL